MWLDDSQLIFSIHKDSVAEITKLNAHTLEVEKICEINKIVAAYSNAKFSVDLEGEIIFLCSHNPFVKSSYKIDIENKAATKLRFEPCGYNFQEEIFTKSGTRNITFENNSIGDHYFSVTKTTEGLMAIEETNSGLLRSSDGIKIWSSETREWERFEIPKSGELIGWVNGL